jgi:hypothetical protein
MAHRNYRGCVRGRVGAPRVYVEAWMGLIRVMNREPSNQAAPDVPVEMRDHMGHAGPASVAVCAEVVESMGLEPASRILASQVRRAFESWIQAPVACDLQIRGTFHYISGRLGMKYESG